MRRRRFMDTMGKAGIGLAGSGVLVNLMQACSADDSGKKWNIVFILTDDQGWNQVNYHGFGYYETPNIDRIAREGIHFTDAYASAPVCSPTRASLMTGKHPARLHITDYIPGSPYPHARLITPKMAPGLPLEEVTIPELMRENGYVTGHFGKWHLSKDKNYEPGRPQDPGSQGFDEVFTSVKPKPDADPDSDAHHAIEITERSLKFIEKHKERPFFCYVTHHVVHRPLMENKDLVAKYEAKPGADKPEHNPVMGAMIERLDSGIGKILQKLDDLDLTKNTIVIYYSDNGGFEKLQDQAPLRGGKAMIYEGGIKVPMAIRWPGVIEPGSKSQTPVTSDDFLPTIMSMTGIKQNIPDIDGKDLMPLLDGSGTLERDALYWHYPHYHHQGYKPGGAIRDGDYKLIEWFEETLTQGEKQVNLFNVRQDPGETKDLAAEMPEKVASMREKLRAWRKKVGAQEMKINPDYDPKRADFRFTDSK